MYVRMYIHTYVRTMYVCMYDACIHICMYVCAYLCVYVCECHEITHVAGVYFLCSWLRERHSIPDTVNHLFTQNLNQRLQQYCINPTYRSENKPPVLNLVDSFISSSHLFQGLAASTNSFSLPVPSLNKNEDTADYNENQEESAPADRFVVNMYFGKKPRQLGKA